MRETLEFDLLIVGAGPAGLAAGIRAAQLAKAANCELNICIIDKAAEIGGQCISGAVLDPHAIAELLPDWQQQFAKLITPVTHDEFLYLTKQRALHLPTPPQMRNHGHFIVSLAQLTRALGQVAESYNINLLPGFAGTELLFADNRIIGVATGDKGIDRNGNKTPQYQPGFLLKAPYTLFAEGCRGSLSKQLLQHFQLAKNCDPQTYGLGIKEVWEIPTAKHQPGLVIHSIGWPLDNATYGGGFLYHFGERFCAVGFVVGLDYQNPYLNPYQEMQRYKTHPYLAPFFAEGKRIAYGARALIEGGMQALPTLTFPGGALIGDAAGFLNVPKIKGIHTAMKSGMLAAESIFAAFATPANPPAICDFTERFKKSWLHQELYRARNIRPAMRWGLIKGLVYAGIDTYLLRGHAPWTLHHKKADHETLVQAKFATPIHYPKPDLQITFPITDNLFLAQIEYDENQPCHLHLADPAIALNINYQTYAAPETRYCPANVYEIVMHEAKPRLQINYTNCIHCKACDIKDPTQNITWTPPEGGNGPNYSLL